MDETIIALMKSPRRYPRRVQYERVGAEVREAVDLYQDRGWLDDPRTYHRDPPPAPTVDLTPARSRGLRYEHLAYESEFEPWDGEPARDRWLGTDFAPNRTAHAWVVRHDDDEPRPWLVCVHGFGAGTPFMDFPGFRARRLHKAHGLNLIFPVLPLHGPRRIGRFSGREFMSFDMMHSILGMAQAAWDIRRAIAWARQQGAQTVGIYGISLGGYAAALTASLERDLDLVMTGVPATDLPGLYGYHCPPRLRPRAEEHHLLGDVADASHRVVSPLALHPQVPHDGRFIFAGLGDRMSTPKQAYRLWLHWDRPGLAWYPGNHVGYIWSREVDRFVRGVLTASGFAHPPTGH